MKAYALTVAALLGGALAAPPCPPPVTWQVPDTDNLKILSHLFDTCKTNFFQW